MQAKDPKPVDSQGSKPNKAQKKEDFHNHANQICRLVLAIANI